MLSTLQHRPTWPAQPIKRREPSLYSIWAMPEDISHTTTMQTTPSMSLVHFMECTTTRTIIRAPPLIVHSQPQSQLQLLHRTGKVVLQLHPQSSHRRRSIHLPSLPFPPPPQRLPKRKGLPGPCRQSRRLPWPKLLLWLPPPRLHRRSPGSVASPNSRSSMTITTFLA